MPPCKCIRGSQESSYSMAVTGFVQPVSEETPTTVDLQLRGLSLSIVGKIPVCARICTCARSRVSLRVGACVHVLLCTCYRQI